MNNFEALGISFLASILAVMFLWLSDVGIDRFLESRVGSIFSGIHYLAGTWTGIYEDDNGVRIQEEWTISQFSAWLKGRIRYTEERNDGSKQVKDFLFEGILRNKIVSIYYYNASRRHFGSGCHCFEVGDDGDVMVGTYAIWDSVEGKVVSLDRDKLITYQRKDDLAPTLNPLEIINRKLRGHG